MAANLLKPIKHDIYKGICKLVSCNCFVLIVKDLYIDCQDDTNKNFIGSGDSSSYRILP